MVACGNGRQNVTGNTTNQLGVGVPGTIDQKVRSVLNTFRCANGAAHVLTVLRFDSVLPGAQGQRSTTIALNESGAKQIAVGIQQDRNVVVVKDYGYAMDAYFYMCNISNINGAPNQPNSILSIPSATIETEFQTTPMNPRCSFNQIAMFNVRLHIGSGYDGFGVPFAFFPVDMLGSVPQVCESNRNGNNVGSNFGTGPSFGNNF